MDTAAVVGDNWACVRNMFPADLEGSVRQFGALTRKRQIACADDLLRLALGYSVCDMSLRQTAAWADAMGLCSMSDVAVMERLQKSEQWLGHLIVDWLQRRRRPGRLTCARVRIIDATVVTGPGSTGTDWRLHFGLDLERMCISSVELTGSEGGESFTRHQFERGEIAVGDRGYGQRAGVAGALEQHAHVLVRINWQNFPLLTAGHEPLDILGCMEQLKRGEIGDWQVAFEYETKLYPVRLIAIRKSPHAAEKERLKIRREARRKHRRPDPRSLRAAAFTYVLSDLPADVLPADEALELYRLRWQIEILFKRLKGILNFDGLRAQDERLVRTYIYGKILGALIVDELRSMALVFFPWGYPLRSEAAE